MRRFLSNIFIGFVSIMFFIVVVYNLYNTYKSPPRTEVAEIITKWDTISVDGIAIRKEEILSEKPSGFAVYNYSNGSRVAKNSPIISVYNNSSDIINLAMLESLQKELDMLNASGSTVTQPFAYTDVVTKQLADSIIDMSDKISAGNIAAVENYKFNIISLFNSKNAAMGKDNNFTMKISELESEISRIKSNISGDKFDINAMSTGYFVSSVDGYENYMTLDDIEGMSSKEFTDKLNTNVSGSKSIGKIILDYDWYFACVVPNNQVKRLSVGKKLHINFAFEKLRVVEAFVHEIKSNPAEDSSIVIFKSTIMDENLATLRKKEAEIIFGEYEGLRIPNEAIGFSNGEKGVWISIGTEYKFRKVDIIYSGDDYFISDIHSGYGDYKNYVQAGDLVVVDTYGLREKTNIDNTIPSTSSKEEENSSQSNESENTSGE